MRFVDGIDPREVTSETEEPLFMVVRWFRNRYGNVDLAEETFMTDCWADEVISWAQSQSKASPGRELHRLEVWVLVGPAHDRFGTLVWRWGTPPPHLSDATTILPSLDDDTSASN